MVQPTNRRLATEQFVADAGASKVNSSTYVAGLATKQDTLPPTGAYTYNADGTVASEPSGKTYTYNADGTVHTETLNGVTRTYSYDANFNVTAVS